MTQVNSRNIKWLQGALVLSGVLLLLLSATALAATQQRCETYVQSSLQQYKESVANLCYVDEARWSDDAAGQKKWCLSLRKAVSEEVLNAETSARAEELEACKGKSKPYDKIFALFKLENPEYTNFQLSRKAWSNELNADMGDVNKDGFDDIIFLIQGKPADKTIARRIVVLKGLPNKKYKTLLINKTSAESFGSGASMGIEINSHPAKGLPYFQISLYEGSMSKSNEPGTTTIAKFGLKNDKLPLRYISSIESWRYESGMIPREYSYDFMTMRYTESWDTLTSGKWEKGDLRFKANAPSLTVENNNDLFKEKGGLRPTPAFIVDNVIRVPK